MRIDSRLTTLNEIVAENYFFNVPIYQRLYVWGVDQVKTLLEDLVTAYTDKKAIFYLGGALVVEREEIDNGRCFDLIDGQQRFTTLWMMSLVWKEALLPFRYRKEKQGRRPRIRFSIRPEVDRFFEQQIVSDSASALVRNPRIVNALAMIESFVEEQGKGFQLAAFTLFVFEKVQMVLTQVPAHTDLNKLFELINNRGIQLQHHEILKARMLSLLPDPEEREPYAKLWDACAEMGNFVEKNLKEVSKLKISELYDDKASTGGTEALSRADQVLLALSQQQTNAFPKEAVSLEALLASETELAGDEDASESDESCESDEVRSIISFAMLLQHTLRIWLHENKRDDLPKIIDKELLSLFDRHFFADKAGYVQVTSFIKLLWNVRYAFDKYVVKWVTKGEEEHHLICKLRHNSKQSRGKTAISLLRQQPTFNEGFALLQSMLYHSQQITTHYWLTPLLAYVQSNPRQTTKHYYAYLRHLDNHLFCGNHDRSLIARSRDFLDEPWRCNEADCSILSEAHGLSFPHYWFYKLEFILWETKPAKIVATRLDDFRMTAKNSIEHISPQTPQVTDTNRVSPGILDTFGNLSLVSRGVNSEYGNMPFNEKRQRFLNRNASRLDSLKMALIYQSQEWNDEVAADHQQQMITLMSAYLKRNNQAEANA